MGSILILTVVGCGSCEAIPTSSASPCANSVPGQSVRRDAAVIIAGCSASSSNCSSHRPDFRAASPATNTSAVKSGAQRCGGIAGYPLVAPSTLRLRYPASWQRSSHGSSKRCGREAKRQESVCRCLFAGERWHELDIITPYILILRVSLLARPWQLFPRLYRYLRILLDPYECSDTRPDMQ